MSDSHRKHERFFSPSRKFEKDQENRWSSTLKHVCGTLSRASARIKVNGVKQKEERKRRAQVPAARRSRISKNFRYYYYEDELLRR